MPAAANRKRYVKAAMRLLVTLRILYPVAFTAEPAERAELIAVIGH
jgi:hypothetical protein